MASCTTPTKKRSGHSHIDTTYNYSSPTLKKAMQPLMSKLGPSPFKYHPILSNFHIMLEPYCDTCFAMKGTDQIGFDLHLKTPHNYPCPNKQCPLQFVEQKHIKKHIPICAASLLLAKNRNIRKNECNRHLINFPKEFEIQKNNKKKKRKVPMVERMKQVEKVWITCYPNQTYCASKLNQYDPYSVQCEDPTYIDPKNNPPIPNHLCYFNNNKANTNSNSNSKSETESDSDSDKDSDHDGKTENNDMNKKCNDSSNTNNNQNIDMDNNNNGSPSNNNNNNNNNSNSNTNPSLNLPNLDYPTQPQPQPLPPSLIQSQHNHNHVNGLNSGYKRKANAMQYNINGPPLKKQKLLLNAMMQNDPQMYTHIISNHNNEANHASHLIIQSNNMHHMNDNSNHIRTMWNRMSSHTPQAQTDNKRKRKLSLGIKTTNGNPSNSHKMVIDLSENNNDNNIIYISDDSDSENDHDNNKNMRSLKQQWNVMSKAQKFRYIFHPFHIYTVSQQFVWDKTDQKKKKKEKPKKKKNKKTPHFKMNKCNTEWTQKDLDLKWSILSSDAEQMHRGQLSKFNGSEISFEFLNFVQIIPYENELTSEHIMPSSRLIDMQQKLFMSDQHEFKYLHCYKQSFRHKIETLLIETKNNCNQSNLLLNTRIFLYSFLRCGVGLLSNGFNQNNNVSNALHIHNTYYKFLNDHFKSQSVYNNASLRDMEWKKEGSCYKEFVFRNNHNITDWSNCTLDLSLKMGGIICNELENLLEQNDGIQALKTLYNAVYPNKQLRLVNIGFFQSPQTNPGQNWHTDYEFTSINEKYTQLSPVVTVVISLINQRYFESTTTGSTVFCLGSNHSPAQIIKLCKKYPNECKQWLYRIVQPVLRAGDMACFAGHTMHFGGAYNYVERSDEDCVLQDRVALYGVLHLLDRTAKHDEYLDADMNIKDNNRGHSLFGGGRYTIERKDAQQNNSNINGMNNKNDDENMENPYFVKKSRWRDRIQ